MINTKKMKKYIPYVYFLATIVFFFSIFNDKAIHYLVLALSIPFVWQIFKPNFILRFILGITTICLSLYFALGYLTGVLNIISLINITDQVMLFGGLFVATNLIMSLCIVSKESDVVESKFISK